MFDRFATRPSQKSSGTSFEGQNLLRAILIAGAVSFVLLGNIIWLPAQTPLDDFNRAIDNLRKITAERNAAGLKYSMGTREESEHYRQFWDAAVAKGLVELEALENASLELLRSGGEVPEMALGVLVRMQRRTLRDGKYGKSYEIGKLLLARLPDMLEVKAWFAAAAIGTDHFEDAEKYQSSIETFTKSLPLEILELFKKLPELKQKFAVEKEIRLAEAQIDDLPRVVLKTTKGRIELELFENQAPETVGNFIHLVERGFYDDLLFHRVISAFMAQGGGMNANMSSREVDYTIFDECGRKDARNHFYGSLSMVKAPFANSAQNQFFLTFVPTPHLDGTHTVFGRVISGFDAMESLTRTQRIDEEKGEEDIANAVPDKIISASVVRKRDHEYRPRKVQEDK